MLRHIISNIRYPATKFRLLYVFCYASWLSWIPFFGLYLKEQNMGGSQIGYVSSLIWIVMLIFQPLWGILADKYGRISCFKVSIIISSLLLLAFFFVSKSLIAIVLCTIFCSLFFITIQPLLDTLVLDYISKEKTKLTYSSLRFWGAIGACIGSQTTSILMNKFSINFIFIIAAFYLLCCIPFTFKLIERNNKNSMKMEFKNINTLFSDKILMIFLLIIVCVSITQTSIWYYITIYLKDIGASDYIAGSAITIDAISELPFYFLAIFLFRRFGLRFTILVAFFVTSGRLLLYAHNDLPVAVLAIELFHGISWTLMWLATVEYINYLVKPEWRATGQSLLWAAYYGAGQILGNVWVGFLYENNSMQFIYGINGVIVFILSIATCLIFFKMKNMKTKHLFRTEGGYRV